MDVESNDEDQGQAMELDVVDAGDDKKKEVDIKKVYVAGLSRPLRDDEELEFDPSSYRIYEAFETTYPCLSFDVIADRECGERASAPYTCYMVAGTEGAKRKNQLYVMKVSNIHPSHVEGGDDSDEEEEENEDEKSKLTIVSLAQDAAANRIKAAKIGESTVCAVYEEFGKVKLWNLAEQMEQLYKVDDDDRVVEKTKENPRFLHSFDHKCEGFGLAWSKLKTGRLATGDHHGKMYLWTMQEGGKWVVSGKPLPGHKSSVEDVMWSPVEEPLLVSCSTDKSIRLWDTRSAPADACVCVVENAHDSDVNVLSWNNNEPLIVSGGDDGAVKVWSLPSIQSNEPVAFFKYHKKPITSIEWSPHDSTLFTASSEDDQMTFWDLSLEADTGDNIVGVPPQLLFVHMGQKEIKEVHWNEQIPGMAMSTSLNNFNIMQPSNIVS